MPPKRRYDFRPRGDNDSSPESKPDMKYRETFTDDEEDDIVDGKLYPSMEKFEKSLGEESFTLSNSSFDQSNISSYNSPVSQKNSGKSPSLSPTLNTSNISSSSYGSVLSPSAFPKARSPIRPENKKQGHSPSARSPRADIKRKKESEEYNLTDGIPMGIAIVIVIICIAVGVMFWRTYSSSSGSMPKMTDTVDLEKQRLEMYETFKKEFKILQKTFKSQQRQVWQTSFGSVRHIVVEQNPTGPAVLMFLIPSDQQQGITTAKCIGQKLVRDLNSLYNNSFPSKSSVINMKNDLKHKNPAEDKLELDRKLQQNFGTGNKGVIIENLEELSPLAALLLHGMCDGDNAPYRDVLFVLLVQTTDDFSKVSGVNYADKYLTNLWSKELDEDRIQPLLSRIANNVAVITAERSDVVESECN